MRALIVVDVQYDFLPGGSLAVPEGDEIIAPINAIYDKFDLVVFTQDYHPANHCSFKTHGGLWPDHCVQGTQGAQINRRFLKMNHSINVIQKGVNQDVDSYSGFWDNDRKHKTPLDDFLKERKIDTVCIAGLATNFCVKFTALDALDAGYGVFLIKDACKGIDINPGDVDRSIVEMIEKGIKIVSYKDFV